MKDAKTLARNPLGIVALFISLIYGFATLLLNSSVDKLCPLERWPLILFIVSFPFAVLFVFYKLVTNHHGKLYSPSDYKDDGSFLQTLSPAEQETKLEMDANEALGNIFIENKPVEGSENLSKTKQRILKVEEFVTDLISKELGIKAETHSKVGVGDKGIVYDAIYVKPRESLVALEVKYYSVPRITIKSIDAFINKITATHEYMSIDTMFILAIVYEGKEKDYEFIFDAWRSRIQNTSIKIDLRLINGREVQG